MSRILIGADGKLRPVYRALEPQPRCTPPVSPRAGSCRSVYYQVQSGRRGTI
jgi:hypothetical protein